VRRGNKRGEKKRMKRVHRDKKTEISSGRQSFKVRSSAERKRKKLCRIGEESAHTASRRYRRERTAIKSRGYQAAVEYLGKVHIAAQRREKRRRERTHRDGQAEMSSSSNDTRCNDITPHDASKNVDKNAVHFWVRRDELKRRFHLMCGGQVRKGGQELLWPGRSRWSS
jgi:hypothetical protein